MAKILTYLGEILFILVLVIAAIGGLLTISSLGINGFVFRNHWKIFLIIFIGFTIAWILRKKALANTFPKYFRIISTTITLILLASLLASTIILVNLAIRLNREDNTYYCYVSSGFACEDVQIIDSNTMTFTLMNGLGYTFSLSNANSSFRNASCNGIYICPQNDVTCTDTSYSIQDGNNATIIVAGCNFQDTERIKGEMTMVYINPQSGLPESLAIDIGKGPVRM